MVVDYIVQKESWFSPIEVLNRYEQLRASFGDKLELPIFKPAREMFAGAVSFLGAYELSEENRYFMQKNNQSKGFDVMGVKQTEQGKKGILAELLMIEVVEFNAYSKENDPIEFLKRTKFSKKKAYGDNTLIVCIINKPIPLDQKRFVEEGCSFNSSVYLIGRTVNAPIGNFVMQSIGITPTKAVYFNADETASKYQLPPRVDFSFAMAKKIKYIPRSLKGMTTYEILGLDRDKIFNIK